MSHLLGGRSSAHRQRREEIAARFQLSLVNKLRVPEPEKRTPARLLQRAMKNSYVCGPLLPRWPADAHRRSNHATAYYAHVALCISDSSCIRTDALTSPVYKLHCPMRLSARWSGVHSSSSLAARFALCSAHPGRHQREGYCQIDQTARDPHDQSAELLIFERSEIPCCRRDDIRLVPRRLCESQQRTEQGALYAGSDHIEHTRAIVWSCSTMGKQRLPKEY